MSRTKDYQTLNQFGATVGELSDENLKSNARSRKLSARSGTPARLNVLFDKVKDEVDDIPNLSAEDAYYRDLRTSVLLTKEEEFALAKNINTNRNEVIDLLCQIPMALKQISKLYISVTWDNVGGVLWRNSDADFKGTSDDNDFDDVPDDANDAIETETQLKSVNQNNDLPFERDVLTPCRLIAAQCDALSAKQLSYYSTGGSFNDRPFANEEQQLSAILKQGLRLRDRHFVEVSEILKNAQKTAQRATSAEGGLPIGHAEQSAETLPLPDVTIFAEIVRNIRNAVRRLTNDKDQFFRSNMRLVAKIARGQARGSLQFLDLVQEGNIALMNAIEMFQIERGLKLSSYATFLIKGAIKRITYNQASTIRIPAHNLDLLPHVLQAQTAFQNLTGQKPTAEQIADKLKVPVAQIKRVLSLVQEPISLSKRVGPDKQTEFGTLIEDKNAPDAEALTVQKMLQGTTAEVLKALTERQRAVLMMRFGIGQYQEHSHIEIGQRLNVTRERIRQIQAKAVSRLKIKAVGGRLKTYYDPT